MGDEDWKEMLAELGSIYFMTEEERDRATEGLTGSREFTFPFMAAGIGAYAAAYRKDGELARRVWKELLSTIINGESREGFNQRRIANQGNREALREIPWVSTNFVAQFCLNAIMALELIRDWIPATLREAGELTVDGEEHFRRA